MSVSVFDLFKIGIGPSSSHTVGPMRAAAIFTRDLLADPELAERVVDVTVHLYGSLAATGRGHRTLDAIVLGLEGMDPETIDPRVAWPHVEAIDAAGGANLGRRIRTTVTRDAIVLHPLTVLPQHSNGMTFVALDDTGAAIATRTMFSIGGGFVVDTHELEQPVSEVLSIKDGGGGEADVTEGDVFRTGRDLLAVCDLEGVSVADAMLRRELQWHSEPEIRAQLLRIWDVMERCIEAGTQARGVLPGGLGVERRASAWCDALGAEDADRLPANAYEWVSLAALAVNEENAAGGRVVTAPTNGAAGIIPATLYYALHYVSGPAPEEQEDTIVRFLLTAGAIGSLYKENASISGAEVGCQGEVGSACSMAAAGLAEVMGAKPHQVENAAEIGMEHNLGLTCDPIAGLVQIPCIERNAMAAIKAITAAKFALRGNGSHHVSLDQVIETMRQTGKDMRAEYKETAMAGLAVNVIEC